MASPIPKFPDIVQSIISEGNTQITLEDLYKKVMFFTSSIQDKTIKNTIQAMERLDYIHKVILPSGAVIFCISKTCEHLNPKPKIEKATEEVDALLSNIKLRTQNKSEQDTELQEE